MTNPDPGFARRLLRLARRLVARVVALTAVLVVCAAVAAATPAAAGVLPAAASVLPAAASALPAAAPVAPPAEPEAPAAPQPPGTDEQQGPGISVELNGADGAPSSSLVILLAVTALSVAPALLLLCTSFTKILVVLSLTRNALGLTAMPPNQVLAGLALFLTMFIMAPVLTEMNELGVQPYLNGAATQREAFGAGIVPLREFMLSHTRPEELALITQAADIPRPASREEVALTTLVPAFVLSELRAAFIIGFVIYVPFLVIDLVVSGALMSMGMMMLPPVTVSLPFKLLLFVLVDGWGLIVTALVSSYR